jgi:hypothetical protein
MPTGVVEPKVDKTVDETIDKLSFCIDILENRVLDIIAFAIAELKVVDKRKIAKALTKGISPTLSGEFDGTTNFYVKVHKHILPQLSTALDSLHFLQQRMSTTGISDADVIKRLNAAAAGIAGVPAQLNYLINNNKNLNKIFLKANVRYKGQTANVSEVIDDGLVIVRDQVNNILNTLISTVKVLTTLSS